MKLKYLTESTEAFADKINSLVHAVFRPHKIEYRENHYYENQGRGEDDDLGPEDKRTTYTWEIPIPIVGAADPADDWEDTFGETDHIVVQVVVGVHPRLTAGIWFNTYTPERFKDQPWLISYGDWGQKHYWRHAQDVEPENPRFWKRFRAELEAARKEQIDEA